MDLRSLKLEVPDSSNLAMEEGKPIFICLSLAKLFLTYSEFDYYGYKFAVVNSVAGGVIETLNLF